MCSCPFLGKVGLRIEGVRYSIGIQKEGIAEMGSVTYEKLLEEARNLAPAELDDLIEVLTRCKAESVVPDKRRPRWEDFVGSAPYPLCGEDAQDWVKRTRRESDEHRSRQ